MASIPLIALAGRPPEQPDTLGQYARIVALKQAQQQMQYQQQMQPMQLQQEQLAIQQQQMQHDSEMSMMDAYSKAGGDLNQTLQLARQSGKVLPQTMMGLQKEIIGYQQSLATLDKTQLEAKHDQIEQTGRDAGALLSLPQNQRVDYLTSSGIGQRWAVDPKTADPTQLNNLVDDTHLGFLQTRSDAGLKDIKDRREALAAAAELPGKQATSAEAVAKNQALQAFLTNPQNAGKTQADYEVAQAAAKAKAEAQARLGSEMTLANYNKQLAQQNMIYEHQLNGITDMFNNPQHGYSQSLSQMQATKQAVLSARDGNELAASLAPVMTALGVASYAGMHRVNQNEINAAGPQVGSVLRQIDARLEKAGAGKLAPGTAQEVADLMDNLIDQKYNMAVNSARLSAQNGHIPQDKVFVMDRNGSPIPLSQASAQTVGVKTVVNQPSGATMKVPGSDGHMHWSDGQRDLGRAD